jgi:prevent-host-death family protein
MEIAVRDAKARLSELIVAAQAGERVVITKNGQPAVEIVRFARKGGVDFDRLNAARARLGLKGDGAGWPASFDEADLSRRVLGLE